MSFITTKNLYKKDAKIDNKKTLEILKYFCLDITGKNTSKILEIEKKTINDRYKYFRKVIFRYCLKE